MVSALIKRLRRMCADVPPPREAPDMVHTDLKPDNVLVHDGAVVAVVDIGNAGSGTRATDLINLVWHSTRPIADPLADAGLRECRRDLESVGRHRRPTYAERSGCGHDDSEVIGSHAPCLTC